MIEPTEEELVAQLGALKLEVAETVAGALSGKHRSKRRGSSVVFVDHRAYRPGDDLRLLDWKAFARTDRDAIKRFEQENQLSATIVVDRSASMRWAGPSHPRTKERMAQTLAASIAQVLLKQGDQVGLIQFTGNAELSLPASSKPTQLSRMLRALLQPPSGRTSNLEDAVKAGMQSGRRRLVVFISDLLADSLDPTGDDLALCLHGLQAGLKRNHHLLVMHVMHPDEVTLAQSMPTKYEGLEAEHIIEANPKDVAESYAAQIENFRRDCRQACDRAKASYAFCSSDEDPAKLLATHLPKLSVRR